MAVASLSDTPFGRYVQILLRKLEDPSMLMDDIGNAMQNSTKERIEAGLAVNGLPFKRSARAIADNGTTLRDTTRLYNAIDYFADKQTVEWGVTADVPYAGIHNTGGTIHAKTAKGMRFKVAGAWKRVMSVRIPRRNYLGVSAKDKQEILDLIYDFLSGA